MSAAGIEVRHGRKCPARSGGKCGKPCTPTFQANVWSKRDKKRIRKTFPTITEAKAWRGEALVGLRHQTLKARTSTTLHEVAETWLEGVKSGAIRTRAGDVYKPSVLRGYESSLRRRILPELGGARLTDIALADVQGLADRLLAQGLDPSTTRNTIMPLRVIFRRLVRRGIVTVNPTLGLELPAPRGTRDRIAKPEEAASLLAALPEQDRPLWACALYAGLRRGELQALRIEDVDLDAGIIRVRGSWDPAAGRVEPKSSAGTRDVPIMSVLRNYLAARLLTLGRTQGLIFGTAEGPFTPVSVRRRAERAWQLAGVKRITLHECRHTFASLAIAAGLNAKSIATYMGHASIQLTFDRYGHLMPGNEAEAAGLLDAYVARADTSARIAQL